MPGNVDNKAIYSLKVLIPFWVLQLLNIILLLAFGALWLQFIISLYSAVFCDYYSYYGEEYCSPYYDDQTAIPLGVAAGGAGLAIGLSVIFLILHITQIALFGRKRLTPAANFGFELPRFILLLLDIGLVAAAAGLGFIDYAVLPLVCILWLLYLGSLIYASVIFHRYRRGRYGGGGYNYGYNPHAYAYPPQQQGQYQQGQYHQGPYQQGPYQQGPHQQGHSQQGQAQQVQYPQGVYQQGPQKQGPYEAFVPQHGLPSQGQQQMQNINQPYDASRQTGSNQHQTSPVQTQQYQQSPNHGQPDVSPIQAHSIPVSTSSPPPQELRSS